MRTADYLLIDIGNTAIKLRLATAEALLGATRRVPTADVAAPGRSSAALAAALGAWRYGRVVMCSVVPEATRRVLAALPKGVSVLQVHPGLQGIGVDLNGYRQRRTLGMDRLANMVGAVALHGGAGSGGGGGRPLIVVDFGTAATFNALDGERRFLGGVIAPGLASMTGYLPARASQLPPLSRLRVPSTAIGRSTRHAMLAGTVVGYRGLIREILDALRAELSGAQVIATGGDARFISQILPGSLDAVEPELTLRGLRVIGQSGST